jgi:hypothetical protein
MAVLNWESLQFAHFGPTATLAIICGSVVSPSIAIGKFGLTLPAICILRSSRCLPIILPSARKIPGTIVGSYQSSES